MIAITGASGQLGRLVIDELLTTTPASEITALVRTPESISDLAERGITVRQADYNEPGTLIEALKGIKKLLLISSSEVGQRAQQHQNVINAAKENGIGLIAYTSILHADTSPLGLPKNTVPPKPCCQNLASRSPCCAMAGTAKTTQQAFPQRFSWAHSTAVRAMV